MRLITLKIFNDLGICAGKSLTWLTLTGSRLYWRPAMSNSTKVQPKGLFNACNCVSSAGMFCFNNILPLSPYPLPPVLI